MKDIEEIDKIVFEATAINLATKDKASAVPKKTSTDKPLNE